MTFKFSSLQQVLDCFIDKQELSPTEIAYILSKSKVIVHKYIKELVAQWKLKKTWLPPHTLYRLTNASSTRWAKIKADTQPVNTNTLSLSYEDSLIIENTFFKFAENGQLLQGIEGFVHRCATRGLEATTKALLYIKIKKHIDKLKNTCWVIDASKIFTTNVQKNYMDKVFYADQYNRMEFGRGKLAELTFYAKQSQNLALIQQSIDMIKLNIQALIKERNIDAIAIVPPSIPRTNQLLKILKTELAYLKLPFINIIKYFPNKIPIPQKSLKTREQRLRNAEQTIVIHDTTVGEKKHIFIIDDFVWSWSTLNETAHKLKLAWAKKLTGFAFVGNTDLKYEVINEI